MLDPDDIGASLEAGRPGGGRPGEKAGGGNADRPEHPYRLMAAVRDEGSGRDGAPARGGDTRVSLGTVVLAHITEVHHRAGGQPDLLELLAEIGIGLQLLTGLISGDPDI